MLKLERDSLLSTERNRERDVDRQVDRQIKRIRALPDTDKRSFALSVARYTQLSFLYCHTIVALLIASGIFLFSTIPATPMQRAFDNRIMIKAVLATKLHVCSLRVQAPRLHWPPWLLVARGERKGGTRSNANHFEFAFLWLSCCCPLAPATRAVTQ